MGVRDFSDGVHDPAVAGDRPVPPVVVSGDAWSDLSTLERVRLNVRWREEMLVWWAAGCGLRPVADDCSDGVGVLFCQECAAGGSPYGELVRGLDSDGRCVVDGEEPVRCLPIGDGPPCLDDDDPHTDSALIGADRAFTPEERDMLRGVVTQMSSVSDALAELLEAQQDEMEALDAAAAELERARLAVRDRFVSAAEMASAVSCWVIAAALVLQPAPPGNGTWSTAMVLAAVVFTGLGVWLWQIGWEQHRNPTE